MFCIIYCCNGWLVEEDISYVTKLFPNSAQIMLGPWMKRWKAGAIGWMLDLKDDQPADFSAPQGCLYTCRIV